MDIVGMIFLGIGLIISLVGSIWFLVEAFKESVLWGLGCLFIPFVALFFLVMHWDRAGKPFLIQLAAIIPVVIGAMLIGPNN
jgi:hypothetical protein